MVLTASLDNKANAILSLHEQSLSFLNLRQGKNELKDEYLQRFNSKVKTLEMSRGEHIFYHVKS